MIFGGLSLLRFTFALLDHTDHQVQTAVADKGADIPRLYHNGRKKRKDLFIKEVMNELFVERFGVAILIQVNILPVQFGQYLSEKIR